MDNTWEYSHVSFGKSNSGHIVLFVLMTISVVLFGWFWFASINFTIHSIHFLYIIRTLWQNLENLKLVLKWKQACFQAGRKCWRDITQIFSQGLYIFGMTHSIVFCLFYVLFLLFLLFSTGLWKFNDLTSSALFRLVLKGTCHFWETDVSVTTGGITLNPEDLKCAMV